MKKRFVITIDGPAGSGKSTTARLVAKRLGFLYIDSGALYRAFTLEVLNQGISVDDEEALVTLLGRTRFEIANSENGCKIFLNGKDVTNDIRSQEVTANVSIVSEYPKVREVITQKQREIADRHSVVLEGRDIGTVVFPDADLKFFMVASLRERAKRRFSELQSKGIKTKLDEVERDIVRRDKHDAERKISPLSKASDAILLDTTNMSIDEQVEYVVQKVSSMLI
ncbi:MAG: (d)CMP kinase [bacterium]